MDTICLPWWLEDFTFENSTDEELKEKVVLYLNYCNDSFENYKHLIKLKLPKEDARGVLPLDTATTVIYTYSVEEWKHIIKLRSDRSSHKNCQIIANLIKKQLGELGYNYGTKI